VRISAAQALADRRSSKAATSYRERALDPDSAGVNGAA
jgi:hypothetical protein